MDVSQMNAHCFKLGCDINVRLIQEEELSNTCLGYLMTSWSPYCFVIVSAGLLSEQYLWWQYQLLDLTKSLPALTAKWPMHKIHWIDTGCN